MELCQREIIRTRREAAANKLARMYLRRYEECRQQFEEVHRRNLLSSLLHFQQQGYVDLITSSATHAFLPAFQTVPSVVRAQLAVAVRSHVRHFGVYPKGLWLPECGYYEGLEAEIAAAGFHNVLMIGSPGSGKSMISKALPSILPDMSDDEILETSLTYSAAGLLGEKGGLVCRRPCRSPHHTISDVGISGGGKTPKWVQEKVDLSPYAGKQILLRFEYVTDDAVNGPGFMVDDISIPEIGYSDGGEKGKEGWEAAGWVLTDNQLNQRWLVQLLDVGKDGRPHVVAPLETDGAVVPEEAAHD